MGEAGCRNDSGRLPCLDDLVTNRLKELKEQAAAAQPQGAA